jgi:hypothetical protein
MSVIGEMKDEEIWDLKVAHAQEIAKLKAGFVVDIEAALLAIIKRKPADPYYMVGGQTHPTITKPFVAEELEYLLDKYEEKPHKAVYDQNGNFAFWYSKATKQKVFDSAGELTVHKLSDRTVKERGLKLPE